MMAIKCKLNGWVIRESPEGWIYKAPEGVFIKGIGLSSIVDGYPLDYIEVSFHSYFRFAIKGKPRSVWYPKYIFRKHTKLRITQEYKHVPTI